MDTLREIWDAILRNKMRTAATGIAVASGLFLLIVLLGASNGIIHTLEQNSTGLALDAVHIYPGWTSLPWNGIKENRHIRLRNTDAEALQARFPDRVTGVVPTISHSVTTASVGKNHVASPSLTGATPLYQELNSVELLRGRFINELDLQLRRKILIIDENSEINLFGIGHSAIGQRVRLDQVTFTVVGISKKDYSMSSPEFFAPATTLQTLFAQGPFVNQIHLKSKNLTTKESSEQFTTDLRTTLANRLNFDPSDDGAVWIWNTAEDNATLQTVNSILHLSFWILGLLTLLSGIVGVSNIMLITVKERTREFGIRKALGARPWSIIRMVILESVLITASFGYIGMLAGIAFCEWMASTQGNRVADLGIQQQQYFIDPTVGLTTCLEAMLVLVIAGALAGFFPARRAAKVKPVEALHG